VQKIQVSDIFESRGVVPISDCDVRDPRMKRTRQLLQGALRELLKAKRLDEIGVQDIAGAATVNRATFYDHYTDKFALFDAMIASGFHKLLEERDIRFDGTCSSGLAALILAVSNYLQQIQHDQAACAQQDSFSSLMDRAITLAIRRIVVEGLRTNEAELRAPREVVASAVSGAIYGAAKEWFYRSDRQPDEDSVASLVQLVLPLFEANGVPRRR
jgi:AcrR family transcriptional regulator